MEIDYLQQIAEVGMGSRLKRLSEYMMRETQIVYDYYNIDFDPYLFPTFKIIINNDGVTNKEINNYLKTTQPATTQAINKLLKKKLILIKESKVDKRKKNIFLSNKGKEFVKYVTPFWKSIEDTIIQLTTHQSNSLVEHITILEQKFSKKTFSETIINTHNQNNES